jgi:hypothetical protein
MGFGVRGCSDETAAGLVFSSAVICGDGHRKMQPISGFCKKSVVLWIDKLFAEDSQRGVHNFLGWIEQHQRLFSVDALKRRRALPDDHWLLERALSVTHKTVKKDRSAIASFEALKSFRTRRDKFHAHFDRRYFDDRKRIAQEAPLKWSDLDKAMELFKDILNRYSAAYDGGVFHIEPLNVNDLNDLLDYVRRARTKANHVSPNPTGRRPRVKPVADSNSRKGARDRSRAGENE